MLYKNNASCVDVRIDRAARPRSFSPVMKMYFPFLTLAALLSPALATFDIDSNPNAVAVCYSVWHSLGFDGVDNPPDITDIENGVGAYAGQGVFHFWGRPDGGYYQGGNRAVLDRHFSQIAGSMIDFIVIDATNCEGYGGYQPGLFTEPTDVLMDEMLLQRQAGNPTPSVVFWARSEPTDADPGAVVRFCRDHYHNNASYSDLFVTLGGLPLILTTNLQPDEFNGEFTMRKMWGEERITSDGVWSFLQNYEPQDVGTENGVAEEISVSVAYQIGYMSDKSMSPGRQAGQTFQNQWVEAFNVHPKVVMLSWWNEWMAQRQTDDANGNPQFVDEFDSEWSKDIEPQASDQPGHQNDYFSWNIEYIRAYKANQPIPTGLVGY